jgi:O-antigen/teichoic acid export membrane protein
MEDAGHGRQTLFLTLVLRGVNAAGQIAIALFLLKAYGAATVGYFAVFISNTMLASLISRQGFDRTLTAFAVRPRASAHAQPLFWSYARTIAAWSPLTGMLNVLAYRPTVGQISSVGMVILLLLLPAIVALSALAAGYFTGFGRTVAASVQQPAFSVALTAAALAGALLIGIRPDVYATYSCVAAGLALVGLHRIRRDAHAGGTGVARSHRRLPAGIRRLSLQFSRRYLVINFFTTFSSVYFISFLALFVSGESIGEFRVVERLALVIAFNLTFINIVLPGAAIRQRLAGDHDRFDRAMRLTFLFQYATAIPICVVYLLFMGRITAWLGIDNAWLYVLLLGAQLINALTGPVRVILMFLNGQRVLQVCSIAETFGSALLYWVLYSAYGVTGLAIAYFLAISVPNLLLAWIVHARFGIIPLPFVPPAYASRARRT